MFEASDCCGHGLAPRAKRGTRGSIFLLAKAHTLQDCEDDTEEINLHRVVGHNSCGRSFDARQSANADSVLGYIGFSISVFGQTKTPQNDFISLPFSLCYNLVNQSRIPQYECNHFFTLRLPRSGECPVKCIQS